MKNLIFIWILVSCFALQADKIKVCATVTDLASIVEEIGGQYVELTTFAPAMGNPHNVIAKPSFIRQLSKADLYIQVGFDLESGWAPVLLKNCRNARVQHGQLGYLDASTVIQPLFEKEGALSRADGHVHAKGNPHYLMDPVNGLSVAELISTRLKKLLPEQAAYFNSRTEKFRIKLLRSLIGNKLVEKYPSQKLLILLEKRKLKEFLRLTKQDKELGGWLHLFNRPQQPKFLADHSSYLYLTKRLDIDVIGYLEPKPGMTPTTSHLMGLIKRHKGERVKGIFTSSYISPRYTTLLTAKTSWPTIKLAHQVGALPKCPNYTAMINHNINRIVKALNEL